MNKLSQRLEASLTSKSMLSYPGGKSRAVQLITAHFPANLKKMCSPFLGGGSIELHMAAQGTIVFGYDIFQPLVEFWQALLANPRALADLTALYHPLTREQFYKLQEASLNDHWQRAAAFFALNKTSFSGCTYSGGYSAHNSTKRFTPNAIERVRAFNNPNLIVNQLDFEQSIKQHNGHFLYLDPPYLINQALYGKKGNTHKNFDHLKLHQILSNRDSWVMSYNDCPKIRELYKDCEITSIDYKYGMSNNRSKSSEIVIKKV